MAEIADCRKVWGKDFPGQLTPRAGRKQRRDGIRYVADFFITLIVGKQRSQGNLVTRDMLRTLVHDALGEGALDSPSRTSCQPRKSQRGFARIGEATSFRAVERRVRR